MRAAAVALAMAQLVATASQAQTYKGAFAGGEGVGSIDLSGYPDGSTLRFTFSSPASVDSGSVDYVYQQGFDQYFDVTGASSGGDNEPSEHMRPITGKTTTTVFTTPSDYTLYYPDRDIMERDYFSPDSMSVDVFADTSDGTPFQFTVSAIPEPGVWAMMLVGFSLVGAALRQGVQRPRPGVS